MAKIPSDLEIAQNARLKPIKEVARGIGILESEISPYGDDKAKITPDILNRLKDRPLGKYIDVTAITPTPLGEGKTVTTIGLAMALNKFCGKAIVCIRQPSLGPVFGIKGGAAGGGYSQVIPMEDFNLHLTGDVHAVGIAHNLLAAFMDNSIFRGNKLDIDLSAVMWRRVVDVSDRSLRNITIGQGSKDDGIPRNSGFDITVSSEAMAILALTDGLKDLRGRIGRIVVGYTKKGKAVTAEDLKAAGAMTVLLKDAIKPNLLQTLENTPCLVHAGPFANIAHGNSSIIADSIALRLADYVVTESGFGADCGAEKFFNIKCRVSGLKPNAVVMVASIRALKMHSGRFSIIAGKPLDKGLLKENVEAVVEGCSNLRRHIEGLKLFGIPVVVALNKFESDTDREIDAVNNISKDAGAFDAVVSELWEKGSDGGKDVANAVMKAVERPGKFSFLYPLDMPIKEKIRTIATKIYGAKDVSYSKTAEDRIKLFASHGYGNLPICMAKTHLSLSHDPNLKGAPSGFTLPITDVRASIGAGFLYPLCGEMRTMPGLPSVPAGTKVDIDANGKIRGLF